MKISPLITLFATAAFLTSCSQTMGPDYLQPELLPPANYKIATSSHHGISQAWWKVFRDPKLSSLQNTLSNQNLDLKAAYARRQQAFAQLNISEYRRFPAYRVDTSIRKIKGSQTDTGGSMMKEYSTQYNLGGSFSYELDIWGRVKRSIEASKADAAAADFAVENVRVALQTQLARNYFTLRFLDAEMESLRQAVNVRKKNLAITEDRLNAGIVTETDTSRARAELSIAEAELLSIRSPRTQLENSIAVLLGAQPSTFSISTSANGRYNGHLPSIPAGIPAALLYRRPDVAIAERRLAASSARIGVAEAARYPKLSLTGSGGLSTISPSKLLNWSSAFYTAGPHVTTPILQGRTLKTKVKAARAAHTEALANYQKTTLGAFADVENALTAIQALNAESVARQNSLRATTTTYELSNTRYKEGVTSYLDVVDAQREQLKAQRIAIRTRGKQFAAATQLIQALGGGFSRSSR